MLLWIKVGRYSAPAKQSAPFRALFLQAGGGTGLSLPLILASLVASGDTLSISASADAETVSAGVG